ncbi:sensor histidine kinase [Paenibacillus agaridevorans]|uniref:sensor histidine kinase n=1 Tax=Paenibacillus agaridevorans TaxID=171404 RepID=UPI000D59389F|nr:sensor histidine kinase [Paenibacillus agaridevorans]
MKRGTLYRKLLLYFLIVIVLSLASVGVFSYVISSKELDVLAKDQMVQIVNNSAHHTDLYLKAYERATVSLLTNMDVKRFIDLPQDRGEYEFYDYRNQIRDYSAEPVFIRSPEIAAIYIISFNGNAVYYFRDFSPATFSKEEVNDQLTYFRENTFRKGTLSILNYSLYNKVRINNRIQEENMLTIARQIRGLKSVDPQGVLAIEFRASDLSALWQGIDLGENGYFFIVDDKGEMIYHPQSEKIGAVVSDSLMEKIKESDLHSFEDNEDGTDRMYMSRKSDFSGWHLVVSKPVAELRKPISNIRTTTIIVGGFTLVVALWFAFRFSKSITGPIRILKNGMRKTEKGNWEMIPLPPRRDEITELMMRYNIMVNRLSELIEEVYQVQLKNKEIQIERQKAEFQSLQLQINPHFLYNSMETIICYAVIQDSEEISEIVQSLAYMLRYSSQTNLEEITVVNELKHVMYFLVVLRHRIGHPFEIDIALDSQYLLYHMVRLTLQPLVENVFQHAFPNGVENYHYVRIAGGEKDDTFWISVEDNGAGMPEETLAELNAKLNKNRLVDEEVDENGKRNGIGILNVHRRIQMVFGDQYGLRIESQLDHGTKMLMIMPLSVKTVNKSAERSN